MTLTQRALVPRAVGPRRRPGAALLTLLRRHGGLVALLAVASAMRAVVVLAYSSALWFPDSGAYYVSALAVRPAVDRPFGYPAFLGLLDGALSFRGIAVVQHLLGVVTVVVVYALLRHRGVSRRASLLAVLPLALDAYVLDIEQFVLAESVFVLLLAVGVAGLLWRARPGPLAVGLVGLLVGLLSVTRTVGTFVAAVLAVYLVVRVLTGSLRWTVLPGFAVGAALVLLPYAAWFAGAHGSYSLTAYTGHFLYGRVSSVVDCDRLSVPERLRPLCPAGEPATRPNGDAFVWGSGSPANAVVAGLPVFSDADLEEFSLAVIARQPLDVAGLVLHDVAHYALPGRSTGPRDACSSWWDFPVPPTTPPTRCVPVLAPDRTPLPGSEPLAGMCLPEHTCTPGHSFAYRWPAPHWSPPLVSALQRYQRVVYTPGPVLALCALAGLALPALHRRPGVRPVARGAPSARLDPALLSLLGLVLVAAPSATSSFDYRYLLPTLVVLPPAAVLAATLLRRRADPDGEGERTRPRGTAAATGAVS